MKNEPKLSDLMMAFFVCTACITILEGVMGMIFFPDEKLGYEAFFAPPILGFLSVLCGVVTWSKKELSVRQVLVRRAMQLLLIEVMIFGLNYLVGNVYEPVVAVILAFSVALVFVTVYVVLWFNDRRSAVAFNKRLKEYQRIEGQRTDTI